MNGLIFFETYLNACILSEFCHILRVSVYKKNDPFLSRCYACTKIPCYQITPVNPSGVLTLMESTSFTREMISIHSALLLP